MTPLGLASKIPARDWYFLRHGTTEMNRAHILNGRLDEPLSAEGIAQAEALAPRLASLDIQQIYTSPLQRAKETARIIASALDLTFEIHDELAEAQLGVWEGQVNTGQGQRWLAGEVPLGGISYEEFRSAVAGAVEEILESPRRTLIVSHGAVHWALCVSLGIESPPLKNCHPVVFQQSNGLWQMQPALDRVES